jgi:hypothetical protein
LKQETESRLAAIFAKHEATKISAAEVKNVVETKEQTFLREFLAARGSLIRPAMQEIGEYVKGRGYAFDISTEEDHFEEGRDRRHRSAAIRITFFPGERRGANHEYPGLSLTCNKAAQLVEFHESAISPGRGGMAGGSGSAKLAELTAEEIQRRILKVVAAVFT